MKKLILAIPLLFSLFVSAQRFSVGPGEYYCTLVDTVSKSGYIIAGNATLCPGLPTGTVTGCAGGAHHAGFIAGGNVWMIGDNTNGELGNGTTGGFASSAVEVTTDSSGNSFGNVIQLCLGMGTTINGSNGWTSAALKSDGTVWVWGWTNGLRGSGTAYTGDSATNRPVRVSFPAGTFIKKIQINTSAMALDSAGNVWTWAANGTYNGYYTVGRGNSPNYTTPAKISLPARAVDIGGGAFWNYALLSTGSLYGWGPFAGYLGIGSGNGGGTLYETPSIGSVDPGATPILLDTALNLPHPVAKIYVNSVATFAILTDSTLWGWGDNAEGNLGQGTELNFATYTLNGSPAPYAWDFGYGEMLIRKPVQIAPGKHNFTNVWTGNSYCFFAYAEDSHGQLYSWGRDKGGTGGRGGGVLGLNRLACDSVKGNINASYPNSWDRTYPTPVNTDTLFSNLDYYTTCPLCIASPSGSPCNLCVYPAPTTVTTAVTATMIGGSTIVLHGSASSSNHISYHIFTQLSGPALNMGIQAGTTDTINNVGPGTYVFQFKATDSYWNKDSSTVTVTLSAGQDSIRIQFDTFATQYGNSIIQSNFVQMRGDPSRHVITATGGNSNSIIVSSIATSNWTPVWGLYSASPGGWIPTSFFSGADTALSQVWLNAATSHTAGVYQLEVSGLHAASTYTIRLSASTNPGSFYQVHCTGTYQWFGASASAADTLNAQPGGVANTTNGLIWSSVQPNDSGQVFLAFNAASSSQTAGFLGAITITENAPAGGSANTTAVDSGFASTLPDNSGVPGDVVLYPNPTKGSLYIRLGDGLENGATIGVYRIDGQIVKKMEVYGVNQVVSMSELSPGMYLIRIGNGEKMVVRKVLKE